MVVCPEGGALETPGPGFQAGGSRPWSSLKRSSPPAAEADSRERAKSLPAYGWSPRSQRSRVSHANGLKSQEWSQWGPLWDPPGAGSFLSLLFCGFPRQWFVHRRQKRTQERRGRSFLQRLTANQRTPMASRQSDPCPGVVGGASWPLIVLRTQDVGCQP